MLSDYLKEKDISIYNLAKKSGLPYSSVNDLANGRVDAANCRAGMLFALASALELSMDRLYELCRKEERIRIPGFETEAVIRVKNKTYYTEFVWQGRPFLVRVCPVNELNTLFIRDLAAWHTEDFLARRKLEELTWKAS